MRRSSLLSNDEYDIQRSVTLGPRDNASQYAPIFGNFRRSPDSSPDPTFPSTPTSPQDNAAQHNSLPLLQFGDWEEGRTYDENPPACIHYLIEWKITLNNRTVAKDTEQDLVLALRFYWRLFLQPKLKELLIRKFPHRKLESDDNSVVVSATRQKGLTRRFDRTDVDWSSIEKQLFNWGDLFLVGKTLRLGTIIQRTQWAPPPTAGRLISEVLLLPPSACFKSETNRSGLRKKYWGSLPPGRWCMLRCIVLGLVT